MQSEIRTDSKDDKYDLQNGALIEDIRGNEEVKKIVEKMCNILKAIFIYLKDLERYE